MKIGATPQIARLADEHTPGLTHSASPWVNPAAAAALRSSVDMLKEIESGIMKNFQDVDRVRNYSVDLHTTGEIFNAATDALTGGAKEDDQFLPLVKRAGTSVFGAETRLASKEITSTWPAERGDILSSIRSARVLTENVAKQLDPTTAT